MLPEESPQHLVTIDYRFALGAPRDLHRVRSVLAPSSQQPPGDEGWSRGRFPVINVSWNDAQAFVAWLSSKTHALPIAYEAEWEDACRASDYDPHVPRRLYQRQARELRPRARKTSEVGSVPGEPLGLVPPSRERVGARRGSVSRDLRRCSRRAAVPGSPMPTCPGELCAAVPSATDRRTMNTQAVRCDHDVTIPDRQHGFRVAFTI